MSTPRHSNRDACTPKPLTPDGFNLMAKIPYGCQVEHIREAMNDFLYFLGFVNTQLHGKELPRLESLLMPANFSSMVGEFVIARLPHFCPHLVKNTYHNGHPDLLPKGEFPGDSAQHTTTGIEIKASRHQSGWQGHNAEEVWLLVFVFDSNTARDYSLGIDPRPFRFRKVLGAQLCKEDWSFSGRSAGSRRTITASVTTSGVQKMNKNWIYKE